MTTLSEILLSPERRDQVTDDCVALVDAEVGDKKGVSGFAIKAGYKAVSSVRPGFIRNVVYDLLPSFADALNPLYQEADGNVAAHIKSNPDRAADALLSVTDARAARADRGVVKSTYDKLRGVAKKHVAAAVPRLADIVEKHTRDLA